MNTILGKFLKDSIEDLKGLATYAMEAISAIELKVNSEQNSTGIIEKSGNYDQKPLYEKDVKYEKFPPTSNSAGRKYSEEGDAIILNLNNLFKMNLRRYSSDSFVDSCLLYFDTGSNYKNDMLITVMADNFNNGNDKDYPSRISYLIDDVIDEILSAIYLEFIGDDYSLLKEKGQIYSGGNTKSVANFALYFYFMYKEIAKSIQITPLPQPYSEHFTAYSRLHPNIKYEYYYRNLPYSTCCNYLGLYEDAINSRLFDKEIRSGYYCAYIDYNLYKKAGYFNENRDNYVFFYKMEILLERCFFLIRQREEKGICVPKISNKKLLESKIEEKDYDKLYNILVAKVEANSVLSGKNKGLKKSIQETELLLSKISIYDDNFLNLYNDLTKSIEDKVILYKHF